MHRVLVYRRQYLPQSETFIYEQLIGHQRVKPLVLTRSTPVNLNQFPYDEIYVKRSFRGMRSWLKQQNVRLLHARFGTAGVELMPIAKASKLPLLTSFHGFDVSKHVNLNPSYKKSLLRLFKQGTAFTVNSLYMKKRLVRMGCPAKKITLLHSGIDFQKFPLLPPKPIDNGGVRFLSVGRLVNKKGMDTLIRAFRRVHAAYPKATLTIVGDGEQKGKLQSMIRAYGLENAVTLTGALPHKRVQEELAQCHLFVLASKTGKDGNHEGIPNVIMEAMATGRPVISTYHAGIPELVTHKVTGYLVPEKSPGKLGEMMKRAIANSSEWQKIVSAARQRVEKRHNIRNQRLRLENLYLRLMKQN